MRAVFAVAFAVAFAGTTADAAPDRYFELGPYSQAQQQMARGDHPGAMRSLRALLKAAPDAEEAPQARYLLGLCLIELGDYAEAERLFSELVVTYPVLRDDHLFLRGRALYLWGNRLDAARVLAQVDPLGPRGEEAINLRARALFEASDFTALRDWLEEKLGQEGRLDAQLLYYLGEARHHTSDALAAFGALREVWREAPSAPFAGPALGTIGRLRAGGRPLVERTDAAVIRALEAELSRSKPPRAFAEAARRARRASPALRAELAYARGRLAEDARRFREAAQHFEEALAVAPVEMADLRARSGLHQARVAARYAQDDRALALYAMVADRFFEQPESEEALLAAGQIHLSRRAYEAAQARFEALLIKNPVTPFRASALWGLGWIRYRLGRYQEAQRFFGSLVRLELPPELDAASRYWLARTEAELGRLDAARAGFRAVIERHPMLFYAALAEDQLAEVLSTPASAASPSTALPAADLPPVLIPVEEHVRLGLLPRARKALPDAERKLRRASPRRLDEGTLRHLARLYDRVGQNGEARRIREESAKEYPHALSSEELLAAARRTHPIKYEAELRAAAAEFSISEALLFALVKTESNFRVDAASVASAYGLAQLILPTARAVGARLGYKRITPAMLIGNPRLNLRLGAAYLRELLDRYQGSEPLALAAYNAGPTAVDAWLSVRVRPLEGVGAAGRGVGLMPAPDELVEEISVPETRNYVKAVLGRARSYARLIAQPVLERPPEPPVPEEELAMGVEVEPAELPPPASKLLEPAPGARFVDPLRDASSEPSRVFGTFAPP